MSADEAVVGSSPQTETTSAATKDACKSKVMYLSISVGKNSVFFRIQVSYTAFLRSSSVVCGSLTDVEKE